MGQTRDCASHAIEKANTPRIYGVLAGTNWNDETNGSNPNISHCLDTTEPVARMAELLAEMGVRGKMQL